MLDSSVYNILQTSKTNTSKLDKQLNSYSEGILTCTKKIVIATLSSVVGVAGINVVCIVFYVGVFRKCLKR